MPVSRTIRSRRAKARKYGAKNALYQQNLRRYRQAKALGYEYPKYPPRGGNGDREYLRTAKRFSRQTLFLERAAVRR